MKIWFLTCKTCFKGMNILRDFEFKLKKNCYKSNIWNRQFSLYSLYLITTPWYGIISWCLMCQLQTASDKRIFSWITWRNLYPVIWFEYLNIGLEFLHMIRDKDFTFTIHSWKVRTPAPIALWVVFSILVS